MDDYALCPLWEGGRIREILFGTFHFRPVELGIRNMNWRMADCNEAVNPLRAIASFQGARSPFSRSTTGGKAERTSEMTAINSTEKLLLITKSVVIVHLFLLIMVHFHDPLNLS